MKFIVPEQKGQGNNLQHQEEKKIEISPNEQKNVTHTPYPGLFANGEKRIILLIIQKETQAR